MKRPKSDIPPGVTEVEIGKYDEKEQHIHFRQTECILNGQVVGRRSYDTDGRLMVETPIKDGKKHGHEYVWDVFSGKLESVEPYVDGKLHGLAKQYGRKGNLIGTYRFVHGTGFDIWRLETEDGSVYVSEVFTVKDGLLDGYEWWLAEDQKSVWHERHWHKGSVHGIERMWNASHRLKRGYPKYWIQGRAVEKRAYLRAVEKDQTLPAFREKENQPRRKFLAEIESILVK